MSPRRASGLLAASAVAVLLLSGCGRASSPEPVRTASGAGSSSAGQPSVTEPQAGASPVDGLTPEQLREAVTAPSGTATRAARGPVAEQVVLADGTKVWRVRIPGPFPVRDARVAVLVGSRVIGEGILAPDLGSISAVTVDGTGLRSGAAASYRWEGSAAVAAGPLTVVR